MFQWQLIQGSEWFGAQSPPVTINLTKPPEQVRVPSVRGQDRESAAEIIRARGLVPTFGGMTGQDTLVGSQRPGPKCARQHWIDSALHDEAGPAAAAIA